MVKVKDALLRQKQRIMVYATPCSGCANGRQMVSCMKEHLGAVRRYNKQSHLAPYCLTAGNAFDWTRVSVDGKVTVKCTWGFFEAWKSVKMLDSQGHAASCKPL